MPERCLHSRTEPAYLGHECVGRKCRLCGALLLALNKDASERIDGLQAELAALRAEGLVGRTIRHLAEQGLLYGGLTDELEAEKLIEDTLIALGLVRYEVGEATALLAPEEEARCER